MLIKKVLSEVVHGASVGIAIFHGERVLYANPKILELFRCRVPAEMQTMEFLCMHATTKTRGVMEERQKALSRLEKVPPFVGDFFHENGDSMHLEINSNALTVDGEVLHVCFMEDVTDNIQTKIALDEQMSRYQSIISGLDGGTWEVDLRTNKMTINERYAGMVGYRVDELPDPGYDTWKMLVHPVDGKLADEQAKLIGEGKQDFLKFEARMKHKKGHWIWVLSSGRVTRRAPDGTPLILSGANIEITDKKLAEEKLVKAKADLEASLSELSLASQEKEDFLSIVSHEIRTPLNAVIGLTSLLLRRDPRPDQVEMIKTLKHSSDNLLLLVNDILDYNKIQSRKLELEAVRFNFREFLQLIHSTFKLEAADRGIELHVKADTLIPDMLEDDVTRLNQILVNLISNALKFTKRGSVTLDVTLISRHDGVCTLKFVVQDTGIGINPSNLGRIFEPFHQSDASITRQFGGTGLGLSIVRALVKMFEGSIEVTSTPGMGSTFTVLMTLKEASHSTGFIMKENPAAAVNQPLDVLYVEDVESNRFLVESLLKDFNITCTTANTGIQAVAIAREKKFDVILMDIQMPGLDGYQTTQMIRSQEGGLNRDTPVIAFTAEPVGGKMLEKLKANKIQDVVSKPFAIELLVLKIQQTALPGQGPTDNFSMAFYERAVGGDPKKLQQVTGLVAADLETFCADFRGAIATQNMKKVKEVIHRLKPIIKNLKLDDLVERFEEIRSHEEIGSEIRNRAVEICERITRVVQRLRSKRESA